MSFGLNSAHYFIRWCGDVVCPNSKGKDKLIGGKNHDELIGGKGKDKLVGGAGNDILNGGLGRDNLKGGKGRDTMVFNALNEGVDTIVDFNSKLDLIDLSGIFSASEYAADNSFAQYTNYVQLQQVGNTTFITVDKDGMDNSNEFITLAKLKNTQIDTLSSRNFVMN